MKATLKDKEYLYNLLKNGITDKELTELINEAQKKVDEEKKQKEQEIKKKSEIERIRKELASAMVKYYIALDVIPASEAEHAKEELIKNIESTEGILSKLKTIDLFMY